ncbi:MAG: hypothetical protein ACC645_10670 [Pirellulales bacterium]
MRQRSAELALLAVSIGLAAAAEGFPADAVVRFVHRPTEVGDRAHQELQFEVNLIIAISQNGQTAHTRDRGSRRRQSRDISVLAVTDGRATKARVDYSVSQRSLSGSDRETSAAIQRDPVAGKSYLVARNRADELVITDLVGNRPPPEELAIIARNMDAIGRRNPLASYFDQRTVSVGQTVSLPQQLANELLGFEEPVGKVNRFDMTLVGTREMDGHRCAVFHTRIDWNSPLAEGRPLAMQGEFLLETATCRIASLELSCPLKLEETRGPEGARFLVRGAGSLQIAMRSGRIRSAASTSR